MKRIVNIATILFQVGMTFFVTFTIYMLFALFDYKGGIPNFVGLTLIQPLFALLFSILTIILCGLLGLPIRLNKQLNNWWRKHFYISILLVLAGFISCVISLMPGFVEIINYKMDGMDITQTSPNKILLIIGWFLVATGTLHSYPPKGLQNKFENLVNSISTHLISGS